MAGTDREPEPRDDAAAELARLGPPSWEEFAAARERFMQTVTVAGLESAWTAPARDPGGPRVGSP
jgi:hypothetical protein